MNSAERNGIGVFLPFMKIDSVPGVRKKHTVAFQEAVRNTLLVPMRLGRINE